MRLHRFLPLALSLPMALTLGAAPAAAQTFVPSPQVWTQAHFPAEAIESFDDFGSALAAGDFDGDGFDDLAIGAPGRASPALPGPARWAFSTAVPAASERRGRRRFA